MTHARLSAGIRERGRLDLEKHLEVHGAFPALPGDELFAELVESGLRGRGGAGFPAARKVESMASARRQPIVVVNGAEGEPMSAKDRLLLEWAPHLVLDGAILAARMVQASEIVVAAPPARMRGLSAATAERRDRGAPSLRPAACAAGYVAGEETALLAGLAGRPPLPRLRPPLPTERGLHGRPTLVHNAETLAHLALIARYGASWYRSAGTPAHPGTTLVTVSGAVRRPGVYEVALGTPVGALCETAHGAPEPVRAVLVGGYFGGWLEGDGTGLTLDDASLIRVEAAVGAGVVVVLGESGCPVAETARLMRWMSAESAGQCGPCVHGLAGISKLLDRVMAGRIEPGDGERLVRWVGMVRGRGACRHPDGVARMVSSAIRVFSPEFQEHARRGPCRACATPSLLVLPHAGAKAA